ncbi:MAG: pyruvate dehydrogenase component [Alphaproteobacteria bacterium]|nr:pyruvate dehydrogenase component [Alphaproteobacteria bacterium]
MPVKILMPALSPTMTEGTLAAWKKKEGDTVKAGDVIAEIETDKATMEVEAVDEGTIAKILVAEGTENVAVNTLIAVLLEEGEDAGAVDAFIAGGTAPSAAKPAEAPAEKKADVKSEEKKEAAAASAPAAPAHSGQEGKRIFVSPLAKRIAAQNNVDLSKVTGSGPNSRIVRADVESAMKGGSATKSAPQQTATAAPPASGPDAKSLADAYGMKYREEKVSGMRKIIASRLTESKQTVPHFYLNTAVNIDKLMALRAEINDGSEGKFKLSVNDFVIKASAMALKKVPAANASWNGSSILFYENADISVAVSTPTGLITPIIKEAENKSLVKISTEMKDLATRARDGKLKPVEFQGGTFSVSNLGMFGVKQFDAIINPPQGCILAVGAGEPTPVVINGKIEIATIMNCNLSVDHRVVDGAVGAEYLQALKQYLENPASMLAL